MVRRAGLSTFSPSCKNKKSFLILTRLDTLNPPSLTTVFIDKDTKEWGMGYFTMDEFLILVKIILKGCFRNLRVVCIFFANVLLNLIPRNRRI